MKKKTLIFNWKMNPENKKEVLALFSEIKKAVVKSNKKKVKLDVIVAPPAVYLDAISAKNKNPIVELAGQNTFFKSSGSVTGATSHAMLKDLGASCSIVGHWERREIFGETNDDVVKKVRSLLDLKMKAMICVGEVNRDEKGDFADILEEQILASLVGVEAFDFKNIMLVYQPAWSIGAGKQKMTIDILEQSVVLIQKILFNKYGESGNKIKIIYGGFVNDINILEFSEVFGVGGFLLEKSGLQKDVFIKIIENFEK